MDATSQPYLPARGRFEGAKVVLVGGAGGIGAVMSSRFAAEGATVLVLDRDENAAAEKVRSITAEGGCAEAYTLDATNVTHINEVFGRVIAEHETLDVLVNLPYSLTDAHFEDVTEAEFDCDIHATFKAPFFCIQRAIPALLASQRGASIVNIGSVNGLRAFGSEVYSGAKAALQNLTMNLACRYGRFGVRVNLVACGTVRTPAWGERVERVPSMLESVSGMYPMGRVGTPDDISSACLFLASQEAAWITGSTLVVDGGITAGNREFLDVVYSGQHTTTRHLP